MGRLIGKEEDLFKPKKNNCRIKMINDDLYCVSCGNYCGEGTMICEKCRKTITSEDKKKRK